MSTEQSLIIAVRPTNLGLLLGTRRTLETQPKEARSIQRQGHV